MKTFITNGQHYDVVITVARTGSPDAGARGISLFLVDADSPGFKRGRNLEKLGLHCADTSELFFDDVRGPGVRFWASSIRDFFVLMSELPRERLVLAAGAVATMEGALGMTRIMDLLIGSG